MSWRLAARSRHCDLYRSGALPHHLAGVFVFTQTDVARMPEVTIWCPLGELDLGDELTHEPPAEFHRLCGNRRAGGSVSVPPRVFLLSPAHCGGERTALLFCDGADFDRARRVRRVARRPAGRGLLVPEGLYFRGKLAYAEAFAAPRRAWPAST